MRCVNCPPSATLLTSSLRSIGYSLGTAIADIIDNSISAGAKRVEICFTPTLDRLAIVDDGCGMSPEELRQAMRFGSKAPTEIRDEKDLGRYGLGLKTASFSQCKILTVISKKRQKVSAYRWDLDEIEDWTLIELDSNEILKLPYSESLNNRPHGTVVIWDNLDRLDCNKDAKLRDAERHLRLVFHRYLEKELQIYWNGRALKPNNPFQYVWDWKPKKTVWIGDAKVIVEACQLKLPRNLSQKQLDELGGKEGIRRSQGFYIYRNHRLVVWGKWFGLARQLEANKFLRIRVDVPNALDDQWSLDVKKSQATPPATILTMLKGYVEKSVEETRRTFGGHSARGKRNEVSLWEEEIRPEGSVHYAINRNHPLVQELLTETKGLATLLALMEHQLPIRAIRLACASDRKIENETFASEEEVLSLFNNSLLAFPEGERRQVAYDLLLQTKMFADCADFIQKKVKRP